MRRFPSSAFTESSVEVPNISHSHLIRLPTSRRPLLLVNQNFVVISGSTKAANTSAAGLRISIPVFATGVCDFMMGACESCVAIAILTLWSDDLQTRAYLLEFRIPSESTQPADAA